MKRASEKDELSAPKKVKYDGLNGGSLEETLGDEVPGKEKDVDQDADDTATFGKSTFGNHFDISAIDDELDEEDRIDELVSSQEDDGHNGTHALFKSERRVSRKDNGDEQQVNATEENSADSKQGKRENLNFSDICFQ